MIDTLVEIAKRNPSQAAQIQKSLGREISRLPPNRAGQAIERIESATRSVKGLDKTLAKGAAAEARLLKQAGPAATKWASFKERMKDVSGFNRMTKFSVIMTAGSAVLMAHQGISITLDNVKATDTLWDYFRNCYYHAAWEGTGIGPAFEQAQREEIERYMKEFELGQSPSMAKHLTFTILKTGVYMGRDALIGMLYLPDTIWEYFTQEKEMEAYAAMQNELARVMRQMIKDQREFNEIMANMKKMGLQDSDAKAFLDCLCRECGGSLGGLFNPACTSDIGHGPCQCNGPLNIWKTPLPAGNKQLQYDCFNAVTRMRYEEAQAIFDKWRQQIIEENAKSVQPELEAIKRDINSRKVTEDENTARDVSDRFAAIKDLLLPQEVDTVRASVGPSLENHAAKNVEVGDIDRAVDNQDRALNKVGPRNFEQQSHMNQRKVQYEKWAEKWRETKDTKFREIDDLIRKNQTQRARGEINVLEYQMLKDPTRPLPPAFKDPAFLALKERLADLAERYEQAMQDMWAKVKRMLSDREHRLAIPILEKALEEWEHPHHKKEGLERQLGYHRAELKRAEDKKKLGQHYEKNNELAHAIREYEESLRIQRDAALERNLAGLKTTVQNQAKAGELWAEAKRLQQDQHYAQAVKRYKEGLAIWNDPDIQERVAGLEKLLADRKTQEVAKASQTTRPERDKSEPTPTRQPEPATRKPSPSPLEQLAGTWRIVANGFPGRIEFDVNQGSLSGRLWLDHHQAWETLRDIRFVDERLSFLRPIPNLDQRYTGRMNGSEISGTFDQAGQGAYQWKMWRGEKAATVAKSDPTVTTKPVVARDDFGVVPTAGIPGYNQETHDNISLEQCLKLCTDRDWCKSVDYERAARRCFVQPVAEEDVGSLRRDYPGHPYDHYFYLPRLSRKSTLGQGDSVPATPDQAGVEAGQAAAAQAPSGTPEVIFEVGNIYGVDNGPSQPTVFTLTAPRMLTLIQNYHWNSARGATPGTIALREAGGKTYGPWQSEGSPGQGGVPNAYWTARPMVLLPPGTYTVIDSDPASWAQNAESGGRGFTRIETMPPHDLQQN